MPSPAHAVVARVPVTATGWPCVVVLLLVCSVFQGADWWSHITQRDVAHLSRLGSGAYKTALIK